ncbi:hypothetical protein VKT23_014209 [Stygiomarasmius scandens]|uniref:Uncharacterized protein n=1 Tax=Marasmiellus scandens TaxID=2682957 RepID=A0ABR1J183_9AGAR
MLPRSQPAYWMYSVLLFLSHVWTPVQAGVIPSYRELSTSHIFSRDMTSQTFRSTWQNPTDTLSILLIIGGDIVLQALAQLSGRTVTPVAFSFGWVAYSFNTLKSVVGDGRLMPPPDYNAKVINAKNGYTRDNKSWVLGRLLRDFEHSLPGDIGLCVTVFEAVKVGDELVGIPSIDGLWISGIFIIVLQLCIAAIPIGLSQDWGIMLVTVVGTGLCLMTGMLPQWRLEKWKCRRNSKKVVCLTGGNGKRHVMVIIGNGHGLDLEDLAAAESPRETRDVEQTSMFRGLPTAYWITQLASLILALLWIVLLITVTALEENAWYLLAVGSIGMIQNVICAGARRATGTTGIRLEKIEEIKGKKVMDTLMDVELAYKNVGNSLIKEFFPNGMRPAEIAWWEGKRSQYDGEREEKRPESWKGRVEVSPRASQARTEHNGSEQPKTTAKGSGQKR